MKHIWGLLIVLSIVGVGVALVITVNSAADTVVAKLDAQQSATVEAIGSAGDATIASINEAAESDNDWEYQLVYTFREDDTVESLSETANELGSEGWEYVGYFMNNGTNARVTLFKRPAE